MQPQTLDYAKTFANRRISRVALGLLVPFSIYLVLCAIRSAPACFNLPYHGFPWPDELIMSYEKYGDIRFPGWLVGNDSVTPLRTVHWMFVGAGAISAGCSLALAFWRFRPAA